MGKSGNKSKEGERSARRRPVGCSETCEWMIERTTAAAMRPFILVIAWVCSVLTFVRAIPLPTAENNQELDMLQIPLPNGKRNEGLQTDKPVPT
uniref:Uncharacterized protein n=1 Tax=Glossina palpalis gambiensis TaxID=67801 RepID=A0A1B0BCF3_9MUSC